jgi:hypothetical protein
MTADITRLAVHEATPESRALVRTTISGIEKSFNTIDRLQPRTRLALALPLLGGGARNSKMEGVQHAVTDEPVRTGHLELRVGAIAIERAVELTQQLTLEVAPHLLELSGKIRATLQISDSGVCSSRRRGRDTQRMAVKAPFAEKLASF